MKLFFRILSFACLPILFIVDVAVSESNPTFKNIGAINFLLLQKKKNIVFLTSTTHTGNLGGLAGADKICQDLATSAGLPGKYLAWLSDYTESPATRFTQSTVPYVRVDGVEVASDWTYLVSSADLSNAINVTELGASVSDYVWTNVNEDGTRTLQLAGNTCAGFTNDLNTNQAKVGASNSMNHETWTSFMDAAQCNRECRLYCFEQ